MTESMKFGPEWLRNLSHDGCSQPPGVVSTTPRYQLAEHRYGREEMLALSGNLKPAPDPLKSIPALYVEKAQVPLALIQMNEEETRMWNRGINSDAVLRLSGKSSLGIPGSTRGSRGGSVDRGRGRGRGGYHYTRGLSYEEPGDGVGPRLDRGEGPPPPPSSTFIRSTRPFDRSQSAIVGERGWVDRNGTDPVDWNGAHSPRKEFGAGGRSFLNENWRRHRPGEDEEGWRTATGGRSDKWNRNSGSWREGDKEGGVEGERGIRSSQPTVWERNRGWDDGHHPHKRPFDEDHLPEWAVENPSESGGSFDATGAFHGGGYSDDDEVGGMSGGDGHSKEPRTRKFSEGSGGTNNQRRPQSITARKSLGSTPAVRDISFDPQKGGEAVMHVQLQGSERLTESATNVAPVANPSSGQKFPASNSPSSNIQKQLPPSHSIPSAPLSDSKDSKDTCFETGRHVVSAPYSNLTKSSPVKSNMVESASSENNSSVIVSSQVEVTKPVVVSRVQKQDKGPSHYTGLSTRNLNTQKSDDDLERMGDLVAKLMDEEEKVVPSRQAVPLHHPPNISASEDMWFYRDPQGEEQGPFPSGDMADWFRSGYFTVNLLVRRGCDEHYSQLGGLIKSCGRIPFMLGPAHKTSEPVAANHPPPTQLPKTVPNLPAAIDPDTAMLEQYHFQLLQRQLLLRQQQESAIQTAFSKLSQSEHWGTLTPVEQHQLILQQVASQPVDLYGQHHPGAEPQKNSIRHLLPQSKLVQPAMVESKLDPLQQLIQQMGGLQQPVMHTAAPPKTPLVPAANPANDPLQILLRQLSASKPQAESLWSQPVMFGNTPSWISQQVAPPPGQQRPMSFWDLQGKAIKTEQEILEEQRLSEERRLEELRKEEKHKEEVEKARLKAEEKKRKFEERRKMEEEKKKKQEEEERRRLKEEEEKRKKEEAKKQHEEEVRKLKEEAARRREDEKRRKEEEKEKKRKLEEERQRQEEEQKQEEERKRQEEESARKKAEEDEEQTRRIEQQRRQAEALRRLQEQQRSKTTAWSQPAALPPSLAEIQRQEKEKKERELKEQQQLMQALQVQQASTAPSPQQSGADKAALNLNWAVNKQAANKVQSLSEIQAEEHEQLLKQHERERAERAQQLKDLPLPAVSTIWGAASQSLSWNPSSSVWNNLTTEVSATTPSGFWENMTPHPAKSSSTALKNNANKVKTSSGSTTSSNKNSGGGSKARSKKEEAVVMKLFEHNVQRSDEFMQWCSKTLTDLHASVDIPTFVAFLRDIESPYEVKEYARMYLGDGKETHEFSRQFLERRSKWRSLNRSAPAEDDMCTPAPAVNPLTTDFTEGKGKKPKKNKMFRVDNRILGFNVTAAEDRINVGDRDFVE